MPLLLEHLTANSVVQTGPIRSNAFRSHPGVAAIRPNNESPEFAEWVYQKNLKTLDIPDNYVLGVRDSVTGELIAYAHWEFSHATTRAADTLEDKDDSEIYPPGCNRAALDEMKKGLDWSEKQTMGEKEEYWHLHMLAVLEKDQGKGAGKMLIQWGQQRAATDGVRAYLDSTEHGKPVYEKLGFLTGPEWNIDYSKYGVSHWNRQFPMVWTPPKV